MDFPCPDCGASRRFDPFRRALCCAACGHASAAGAPLHDIRPDHPLDLKAARRDADAGVDVWTRARVCRRCSQCGGEISWSVEEITRECPFCAVAYVETEAAQSGREMPDRLVHFAVDRSVALEQYLAWSRRGWLVPSDLRSAAHLERIRPVYLPYWQFAATARTEYLPDDAKSDSATDFFSHEYQALLEPAGPEPLHALFRVAGKCHLLGAVYAFREEFLAGWPALLPAENKLAAWRRTETVIDERQLSLISVKENAKREIYLKMSPQWPLGARSPADISMEDEVNKHLNEALMAEEKSSELPAAEETWRRTWTRTRDCTYSLVLLPYWVGAYRYHGRLYRVLINGQTGKIAGFRPLSDYKLAATLIAAACLSFFIVRPLIGLAVEVPQYAGWIFASFFALVFLLVRQLPRVIEKRRMG